MTGVMTIAAVCAAVVSTAAAATFLDELMPVPKAVVAGEGRIAAERLRNVTVVRGAVPEAPSATADEAYVLEIGGNGVKITAPGPFGEMWARVTLDQLVRLSGGGDVPCCRITDWPRLKWRGFMLDSSRNYLPPRGVKDVIDVMSRYKLNLFHWHLTENYAWRLESKRFPQLQSDRAFLHRHKGMFYTQEEFRDIVDYAYSRGVRVMPEFDFPGHAFAFRRAFGFKTMSDPGVAETAASLFEELCSLAPKEKMPFIHMGTDEVYDRELEGAPKETLELMAKAIADGGRTTVSWVPGESYGSDGPRINMLWTDKVSPAGNPGAYFDAIGMYIEDFDPFELLSVAVYHKAARWHDAGDLNRGAIFCAWHDGAVGLPYENLLRNQPVFPSCVLFGNAYWNGRGTDLPQFRKCLPQGGDPLLAEAAEVERRVVAQRDRALRDLKHPFHFLRQTDMRWRLTQSDGTLIAKDIAQATISPGRLCGAGGKPLLLSPTNGTVVAETWIRSPKDQRVGAWIGFTNISRDHGMVYTAPLPNVGEWNRFGASVELNGERIAPPRWKRPGLKKGNPISDWTPVWTLYEADEEPFTDQEYCMREPTSVMLRKGWNHVKLTMPNPAVEGPRRQEQGRIRHRWVGTFIPVAGTTDHPQEVPGLEYASCPPSAANCN
ncbi:MAG: family 20 glycosylhydrolase [Kiritimatiellae bacterium]|nr:family 20 glycosylhydrolase [Kiritimatiellia bacterium]